MTMARFDAYDPRVEERITAKEIHVRCFKDAAINCRRRETGKQ
jgi:hypothetical protein